MISLLVDKIKSAHRGILDDWTDDRTVDRGVRYLHRVREMFDCGEFLAGRVRGTSDYVTNVYLDSEGGFGSACTCPVVWRCKHAIALILAAQQRLNMGEEIPSCADASELVVDRQQVEARISERNRRILAEREEAAKVAAAAEAEWRASRVQPIRDEYEQAKAELVDVLAKRDAALVFAAVDKLLNGVDWEETWRYPSEFRDLRDDFELVMRSVVSSLVESCADPVGVLLWVVHLMRPYAYDEYGKVVDEFWDSPTGMYAQPQVWEQVACCLQEELEGISDEDYTINDCFSRPWHLVESIRTAWERAGKEENAIECYLKYVSRIGNWQEVARYLIQHQMYDKAIEIAREGVKAYQVSSAYDNDYDMELQECLADAFSGKGDHLKASAIRAEAFLDRRCVCMVAKFNQTLDEAEKAGVREPVCKALIHALETGWNPSSIVSYKFQPAIQEFDWKPVSKPVVHRIETSCSETPTWPLPWANEGVRLFDSRWQDMKAFCQEDMELLLSLSLLEGDKAEIARRFDDLPETPSAGGFPLGDEKAEMCELVMVAMKEYRDDIVARLANMKKYCYVTEVRDGVEVAVRVVKRLGETAHSVSQRS